MSPPLNFQEILFLIFAVLVVVGIGWEVIWWRLLFTVPKEDPRRRMANKVEWLLLALTGASFLALYIHCLNYGFKTRWLEPYLGYLKDYLK